MDMLKEIILSKVDTEKVMVFLFGSRVFDHYPSRADVDIGLLTDDKLPPHLFHKIRNAVEDSIIPLEIDNSVFNYIEQDTIKSGQIQKFEVCVELFWKTIKKYMRL